VASHKVEPQIYIIIVVQTNAPKSPSTHQLKRNSTTD